MTFVESYGPWAVVAGASEGVGAAFAAAVAREGVNVVLLARRQGVLDEVAARIREESGVEARAVAVDLAAPSAMETVADATSDLDVGLLMYCAGADPNYQPFLANPVEVATAMVHRNCTVPVEMCHHFAGPMAARGRGGIIVAELGRRPSWGRPTWSSTADPRPSTWSSPRRCGPSSTPGASTS